MSGWRDFVTGSDACTPSDGAGPSNAVGALVNNLLGGASKTQEQLRELPTLQPGINGSVQAPPLTPEAAALAAMAGPSSLQVPGLGPSRMGAGGAQALAASIAGPSMAAPAEWDAIFGGASSSSGAGPAVLPGSLQGPGMPLPGMQAPGMLPPAVGDHLKRFFSAAAHGANGMLAAPALPPGMTASLSVADRCRIRDRATILARHMFAEQGEAFADKQVGGLLASLHISPQELPAELPHAHDAAWHEVWAQQQQLQGPGPGAQALAAELAAGGQAAAQWDAIWSQGPGQALQARPPIAPDVASTGWASEFAEAQARAAAPPATWAAEFEQQRQQQEPGAAWAEEFTTAQVDQQGRAHSVSQADAMRSTQQLVDVLSRDADPKMRNSKFLQFVSKMSKGELILEDNKVVERPAQASTWASEFEQAGRAREAAAQPGDAAWADEFARNFAQGLDLRPGQEELESAWQQAQGADPWVQEFAQAADEQTFQEWERIYGHGQVHDILQRPDGTHRKGEYVFAANNPFTGDADAFAKGKDLFRRGVLSEAALALEAEVTSHPNNAEAWRLLGTVHAENDDDQQAIAAMLRALEANPQDLDVLLALGVSHVNELETGEAVQHLATWLNTHPQYKQLANGFGAPLDSSQSLNHVVRMFQAATAAHPEDAELAVALGVLHHLNRQYNEAISAFESALKLRPQDYSLWNKLGATLANNARSAEAINAYQKALDLKPNYMRAWTNMGISLANIGEYNRSARFYVRALALNPGAAHVWGYLRTSLVCAGSLELLPAVDEQRLDTLTQALPLE